MSSKLVRALILGLGVGVLTPAAAYAGQSTKTPAAAAASKKNHKHHKHHKYHAAGKDAKNKK